MIMIMYFIFLSGVLPGIQEYFTSATITFIMVGGAQGEIHDCLELALKPSVRS